MKPILSAVIVLAGCFSSLPVFSGFHCDTCFDSAPAIPSSGMGWVLSVPGIVHYHGLSGEAPNPDYHHFKWPDLIGMQQHQLPEVLEKAIHQWSFNLGIPGFPIRPLPVPRTDQRLKISVGPKGIDVIEPYPEPTNLAKVRIPDFVVVVQTESEYLSARLHHRHGEWLAEPFSPDVLEHDLLRLFLRVSGVTVIDVQGRALYSMLRNGQQAYMTWEALYKLYLLWLHKMRELAFKKFLESLSLEGANVRKVPVARGKGSKTRAKRPPIKQKDEDSKEPGTKRRKEDTEGEASGFDPKPSESKDDKSEPESAEQPNRLVNGKKKHNGRENQNFG